VEAISASDDTVVDTAGECGATKDASSNVEGQNGLAIEGSCVDTENEAARTSGDARVAATEAQAASEDEQCDADSETDGVLQGTHEGAAAESTPEDDVANLNIRVTSNMTNVPDVHGHDEESGLEFGPEEISDSVPLAMSVTTQVKDTAVAAGGTASRKPENDADALPRNDDEGAGDAAAAADTPAEDAAIPSEADGVPEAASDGVAEDGSERAAGDAAAAADTPAEDAAIPSEADGVPEAASDGVAEDGSERAAGDAAAAADTPAEDAAIPSEADGVQREGPESLRRLLTRPRVVHVAPEEGWSCTFMTDIEGHWSYFNKQVEASSVLSWTEDGRLELAESCYFVHGGDSVDKGPGDIRVLCALLNLKDQYPDRVFLVLGNRDMNKLRLHSELTPGHLGKNPVLWDPHHTSYADYVIARDSNPSSPVTALRWMLECTMGCPDTFETRRMELETLRGLKTVDDSSVFDNFAQLSDPAAGLEALYVRYMCLGHIAVVIGDVLFMHGALHADGLGFVPGQERRSADALSWCADMDSWLLGQMHAFLDNPKYREDGTRAFDDLLDYGVPWSEGQKFCGLSSVYSDGFSERGSLRYCDDAVTRFTEASGIKRVCVGHAPQGDCPSVIRNPSGLLVLMCDTMYSNPKFTNWDTRGDAAAFVLFDDKCTHVSGIRLDLSEYEFHLRVDGADSPPTLYVGQELKGDKVGIWVRGITEAGQCLCAKPQGRGFMMEAFEASYVARNLEHRAVDREGSILTTSDDEDSQSFLEHEVASQV